MNQSFSERYQQMRENARASNPGLSDPEKDNDLSYPSAGNARTICFCWPDGKRLFLNYAYLVSGEYEPNEGMINLIFTTLTIKLKGVRLAPLFEGLMDQSIKTIFQASDRYAQLENDESPVVVDIQMEP